MAPALASASLKARERQRKARPPRARKEGQRARAPGTHQNSSFCPDRCTHVYHAYLTHACRYGEPFMDADPMSDTWHQMAVD